MTDESPRRIIMECTDQELVEIAGRTTSLDWSKEIHPRQAQAELMRRNTAALRSSAQSSDRYAVNALVLTVFLFAITGTQFLFEIIPIENVFLKAIVGLVAVTGFIYVVAREFRKD